MIILDTHAAIWIAEGMLKPGATKIVEAAAQRSQLFISPISAWEIGMLVEKGRLKIAIPVHEYVGALFGRRGIQVAPISADIALEAAILPRHFHADPADCLIVATSAAYGARLVTRDQRIHAFAKDTKYLQCVPC